MSRRIILFRCLVRPTSLRSHDQSEAYFHVGCDMYPLQTMTSLVVMTTTVAVWLLPAAGDVSANHTWNTSSTYNWMVTDAPRNRSVRQLNYYRVSRIVFCIFLYCLRVGMGDTDDTSTTMYHDTNCLRYSLYRVCFDTFRTAIAILLSILRM